MTKEIWYLSNYNWEKGTLIKENKKTYTVEWINYENFYHPNQKIIQKFPKEKCAFTEELVCIVWETWKGRNGRGGYRVEKELYPQFRVPVNQIERQHRYPYSGRVTESSFGVGDR